METTGPADARIEAWNRVRARVGLEPVSGIAQPESLQVEVEPQTAPSPVRRLPLPNIGSAVGGIGRRVGGWLRERTQPAEREEEEVVPLPRGRGRFENLVVEAVRTGVRRWWENVNPRNVTQHVKEKDWIWLFGFGVGVAETAAVAYLPLGVNTYIRAGINFAVISGGHLALNIARGAMEARARRDFEAEALVTRQDEIAKRFGEGHERLKKFGLGLAAGVTYTSLGIGISSIEAMFEGPEIPAPAPAPVKAVAPGVEAAETAAETPALGVEAVTREKIAQLSASPDWQTQVSIEVGTQFKITDSIIDSSLQNMGKSLSDLGPASLETARLALQHALETQANTSFDGAMETVVSTNPDADLSAAVEEGQKAFRDALSQEATIKQLVEVSQKAIEDQVKIEEALGNQVTFQLNADPSLFTEVTINRATTVGHILQESGYKITWGPQDAKVFGAHIAANYDLLTNMWEKMADAKLIPQDVFPVSMPELSDLIDKAEAGDELALARLKKALHWIPAGSKFRILNQVSLDKILELLK